jgi:hypothetical protein
MRVLSKWLFVLIILFLASGCASGPKFSNFKPSISSLAPGSGRIFMYRTSMLGFALQPDIMLNGEKIGKSITKGFFFIDRPAGAYELSTTTEVDRKLSLTLDRGQTRYVKFDVSMGFFAGHVYPELIESAIAEKEILECEYAGALIK